MRGSSYVERVVLVNLRTGRSTILFKVTDSDGITVSFNHDSTRLLMTVSPTDVSNGAMEIANVSTRKITALAQGGLCGNYTPDGRRIAFVRIWSSRHYRTYCALATMRASGAAPSDLFTPSTPETIISGMTWNKSGSSLAIEMSGSAFILNPKTSATTKIVDDAYELAWQP